MTPYVTDEEADTYFADRLPSVEWDEAADADKAKSLATATRLINNLAYHGTKTDSAQENEFPRNEAVEVPRQVKEACCEIAYALLEGQSPEKDMRTINASGKRFGGAGATVDPDNVPLNYMHGIPSSTAWNLLRPYLNNHLSVRLERIT